MPDAEDLAASMRDVVYLVGVLMLLSRRNA